MKFALCELFIHRCRGREFFSLVGRLLVAQVVVTGVGAPAITLHAFTDGRASVTF
jgi:hypothetical protein